MMSKNEIQAFTYLPCTITQLASNLNISTVAAYNISERLVQDGLATKKRQGKSVLIEKQESLHSKDLEDILQTFTRLPVSQILSDSSLPILSILDYPLNLSEIASIIGITRQWAIKQIHLLTRYGILQKQNNRYTINPIHKKINSLATFFYRYKNNQYIRKISNDANILWQHGPEILYQTKTQQHKDTITALSRFPDYQIPLISNINYCFHSQRPIDKSDIIIHTILIKPYSKIYHAYACLLSGLMRMVCMMMSLLSIGLCEWKQ
jgi:hypothetical protein